MESGNVVEVAGFVLHPRDSLRLLALTAILVFLLAVGSAVLVMRARVAGAALALEYAEYCAQRVYDLISQPRRMADRRMLEDYTPQRLIDLTRRDANYCGLVLRTVIYAMMHVGTVLVAGAALLFLEPYLTLVVVAILAVAAFFLRRASIKGASHRSRLQKHAAEVLKDRRAMHELVVRSPAAVSSDVRLFQQGAEGLRQSVLGQRQALEAGKLVAQIAMGAALFLVLLVQGGATLSKASNWSALLAYVAALTFFGTSIARVSRVLVSINRFYPPLARYASFVRLAEEKSVVDDSEPLPPYQLEAPYLGPHDLRSLHIKPGNRLAVVLPGDLTRFSVVQIGRALRTANQNGSVDQVVIPWFASGKAILAGPSLRHSLGLPARTSVETLKNEVAALGVERGFVQLPSDVDADQALSAGERQAFSPQAIFLLLALSGFLNQRTIFAFEQASLALLPSGVQGRLLERASGSIALIAYSTTSVHHIGTYGETAVIIAGNDEVFGWTSLEVFFSRHEAVLRALTRIASESRAERAALGADEDLDELE